MLRRVHTARCYVLVLLVVLISGTAVRGQTTSFTYQGRLSDGGTAANGNYDLQFALFDSAQGVAQIGVTQTIPNVAVSSGIFTVTLDFGATAFPGAPRFLEIGARLTGVGSFTTLSPRQQITSTPYAIRSLNASTADAVIVNGVPGGSGNYIQNATTPQANSNFNISGNGTAGGTLAANIVNATTQYNIGVSHALSFGNLSVFVGDFAPVNKNIPGNTFVGSNAGLNNSAGGDNSFFGLAAGQQNTGGRNAFFGSLTGQFNTTGIFNAFFGMGAGRNGLFTASTGDANSFFGYFAGKGNLSGSNNTAIGREATFGSTNLNFATAIGAFAQVDQSNSLVLGSIAGVNGASASVNVGIGTTTPQARLDVNGTALFQGGATVTGTNGDGAVLTARRPTGDPFVIIDATTVAQNSVLAFRKNNFNRWLMYTDNSSESGGNAGSDFKLDAYNNAGGIANYLFVKRSTGAVGIGTTSPFVNTKLDIVGGLLRLDQLAAGGDEPLCRNSAVHTIATCNASSLRYKESVQPLRQGLHLIQRLRPVTFNWRESGKADLGLIAEEVAKVEPLLTFKNDKGEIEGVRYDRLNVVLINAIKQQQDEISRQRSAIDLLTTANAGLSARLRVVEGRLRPKARTARSVVRSGARREGADAFSPTRRE